MKSHVIPTKEKNPDVIILHCGTNDLQKNQSIEEIGSNIISLTTSLSSDTNCIIVSGLTA